MNLAMQIMMEDMSTVIFNRVEIESLNKMAFLKMSTHQAHNSRNTIYNVLTGWFLICENSVNRDLDVSRYDYRSNLMENRSFMIL